MIHPIEVTIKMSNGIIYTLPIKRVLSWELRSVVLDVYRPIQRREFSMVLDVSGMGFAYQEENKADTEVKMLRADTQDITTTHSRGE